MRRNVFLLYQGTFNFRDSRQCGIQEERVIHNDYTISFENQCWQLENKKALKMSPKQRVSIRQHLDGKFSIWFKDKQVQYKAISKEERKIKPARVKTGYDSRVQSLNGRKGKVNSPWSVFNPEWLSA